MKTGIFSTLSASLVAERAHQISWPSQRLLHASALTISRRAAEELLRNDTFQATAHPYP